jgi:beta-glucuronidase
MGEGNSIGGFVFQWIDGWWKCGGDIGTGAYGGTKYDHDTTEGCGGAEWFGITSQGDGKSSPYLRQLRKAYFFYKEIWNKNVWEIYEFK